MYTLNAISNYSYNLKIHGEHSTILYKAIKHILKSAHISNGSLYFTAEKVTKFNPQNHKQYIQMADDLTQQIIALEKNNYAYYGFDIDMILTIDNHYIFCSTKYLEHIDNNRNINIIYLDTTPYFSNPEIMKLTKLPSAINYKCGYYSLGILITYCIFKNYLLVANTIPEEKIINEVLYPIRYTKIYWFIKRCLQLDISRRHILLV